MKKIDMRKTLLAIALISAAIYIVFAGAEYYSHRAALAQWLPGRAATDAAHDIAAGSMKIYVHGSFTATTVGVADEQRSLVEKLPRVDAGVGCVFRYLDVFEAQGEYARRYNQAIVKYLQGRSKVGEKTTKSDPQSLPPLLTSVAHDQDAVVGCYSALIEERSEQASQANESVHPVRAKDLRLTAQSAARSWSGHTAFQVVPANASEQFNFRDAYWIIADGRLSIIFSNTGLSGIQLTLAPTGKGFEGTVEEFWDAGPSVTNKRKVILTRRLC